MKLRYRLFALSLVALIPAIAVQLYSETATRRERAREVRALAVQSTTQAASELDRVLEGAQSVLTAVSKVTFVQALDPAACVPYLAKLQAEVPHLLSIAAIDREGRLRCRQEIPAESPTYSDRPYIRDAMANGVFTVGEYTDAKIAKRPVLPFALPLRDEGGATIGVVAAAVDLRWLTDRLRERGVPRGGSITVADRNGRIIAREPLPDRFIGTLIPEDFRHLVTAAAPGVIEVASQDGTRRVLGYSPASPPRNLYISTGLSSEASFGAIEQSTRRSLGVLSGGVLIALLGAWIVGRVSIEQPVQRMLHVADAWRRGDLSARVGLTAKRGDLGALGEAFDRVAENLSKREAALKESEARFHGVFRSRAMGLSIVDLETGQILTVNDRLLEMTGYTEEDFRRRAWDDPKLITPPEHRHLDAQALSDLRTRGWCEPYDKEWIKKDGSRLPIQMTVARLPDEPSKIVVSVQDLTERKRFEAALRESQERLSLAASAAELGIWDWDLDTGEMVYSPRAREIYGFTTGEPVTLDKVRSATNAEDLKTTTKQVERAFDPNIRSNERFEYRILRPSDRAERWVVAYAKAVFDEGAGAARAVRYIGTIQDITDRKRAELEFRDTASRLRLAIQAGRMAVWNYDIEAHTLEAAPELKRLLGFGEDEEPTLEEMQSRYYPGDQERVRAAAEAALARGERHFEVDYRYMWPDGSVRWLAMRAEIRLSGERPTGIVGVVLDVTETKRAEEHQRLLVNELNHRVKNTLATVQSIVTQTLRTAVTPAAAREALEGRLIALARVHDVLTKESWEGAELRSVVLQAVAPYKGSTDERIRVDGPKLRLSPRMALAIAMALQELATNAVKYGALSNTEGSVSISWSVDRSSTPERLCLRWEETGGPPVQAPSRRGFGTRLIERSLAQELGGEVRIQFAPTGVVCTVSAALQ